MNTYHFFGDNITPNFHLIKSLTAFEKFSLKIMVKIIF